MNISHIAVAGADAPANTMARYRVASRIRTGAGGPCHAAGLFLSELARAIGSFRPSFVYGSDSWRWRLAPGVTCAARPAVELSLLAGQKSSGSGSWPGIVTTKSRIACPSCAHVWPHHIDRRMPG